MHENRILTEPDHVVEFSNIIGSGSSCCTRRGRSARTWTRSSFILVYLVLNYDYDFIVNPKWPGM